MSSEACRQCCKPSHYCVCDMIQPLQTQLAFLILQHPQEKKQVLSSAKFAQLCLSRSKLQIGLSWRNLETAWGRLDQPPMLSFLPSDWGVLYLGTARFSHQKRKQVGLCHVDSQGKVSSMQCALKGFVLLDGTWAQAKTLWWRNAWLMKLRRVVFIPRQLSQYRHLRLEPRSECLSTLEAIAEVIELCEPQSQVVSQTLRQVFSAFLRKVEATPS